MDSPEIQAFFTKPVDQSTSWTATMDRAEIMMGMEDLRENKKHHKQERDAYHRHRNYV